MAFRNVVSLVLFVCLQGICAQRSNNVWSAIERARGLNTFKSWAITVRPFLEFTTGITVFAFNDSSYNHMPGDQRGRLNAIGADDNRKRDYVMTYTILSTLSLNEMASMRSAKSSIGTDVFFARREFRQWGTTTSTGVSATYVNGARIVGEPIVAGNGQLYVLDRPPDMPSQANVYQWIMSDGDNSGVQTSLFKNMMEKLYAEYYTSAIHPITTGKNTFFMPSQRALERIPRQEIDKLSTKQLSDYFRMHYIPGEVLYTSFVNHQESARSAFNNQNVLFLRNNKNVVVKSGKVTASVERGNITVANGVIHIIDTMFGLVYQSLVQQIKKDCPFFGGLIERVAQSDAELRTKLFDSTVNIFVPTDEAFNRVRNRVNFDQNRTLVDFILRMSMIRDGSIEVSQLNGNYDVRQHRMSLYRDWKLVVYNDRNEVLQVNGNYDVRQHRMSLYRDLKLIVYNDRNETWVNGGHVRAKIVKPDIETTTGRMQMIDAVLGVPSVDIPNLIYYDDYLLWTYYDIQSVGLVEYLEDPRFDKTSLPPRNFDNVGNGMGNGMYGQTTRYPGQQPNYPGGNNPYGTTQFPNNNYPSGQNQQYPNNQNPYPNQNNQYPNQNNQYPNQNTQYPNQNNQYPNQNNQYPNQNNPYGPQNKQIASYGRCRDFSRVCEFTYFVPNGSAIWQYKMSSYGRQISLNPNLYRYILRRTMILDRKVYLEEMPVGQRDYQLYTHTGETIFLRKETENLARLTWTPANRPGMRKQARVIMWDLGATNGVVHIIDNVLSDESDLSIDPNGATTYTASIFTLLALAILARVYGH